MELVYPKKKEMLNSEEEGKIIKENGDKGGIEKYGKRGALRNKLNICKRRL